MKIFISWSGEGSRNVALALREWIPDVIQSVKPWMSETDIAAGERWDPAVDKELSESKFGIICLTKENLNAPWILFETGALAKAIENSRVCPYLLELRPSDLPSGPLTKFQAKIADRNGTFDIVHSINDALDELEKLDEKKLEKAFGRWWGELEEKIRRLPQPMEERQSFRTDTDMLQEALELLREISRRVSSKRSVSDAFLTLPSEGISIDLLERHLVEQALQATEGNQTAAAKLLGITRSKFRVLLKRHNIYEEI